LQLVAAEEISPTAILKYLSLDPSPLTVLINPTTTPSGAPPSQAASPWLQISPQVVTMTAAWTVNLGGVPIPASPGTPGAKLVADREQQVKLGLTVIESPQAAEGYAYVEVALPGSPALASSAPLQVRVHCTPIYLKWCWLASEATPQGQSVQTYLGYSMGGEQEIAADQGGGRVQYFRRGMIVARTNGTTAVVYGPVYVRYRALGGLGSSMGQPVSDEANAVNGGASAAFEHGFIYWHKDVGAHEVHGAISDRYTALGGPGGVLGYPTTGEIAVMRQGKSVGSHNRFANAGAIYWSHATGAWEVHGVILSAWEQTYKGVNGPIGFPVAGQGKLPAEPSQGLAEATYGSFETGAIVSMTTGPFPGVHFVGDLVVFVERFEGRGDPSTAEKIGFSGIDLYVDVNISASNGQKVHETLPASGNFGSGVQLQTVLMMIPGIRGDLDVTVWFDGWDSVNIGSDNHLGTSSRNFDARNVWGTLTIEDDQWTGNFLVDYDMQNTRKIDPANFRKELWWSFSNPSGPQLTWEEYAETFSDVSISEHHWEHWFDYLFYIAVYEGIAENGRCFGYCVESIYAEAGRSLFAEPIYQYPFEQPEQHELSVKHGYQLGGDFLEYCLGMFANGHTHDPVGAYNQSQTFNQNGNYPLIALSTSYFYGNGHVVRPYRWHDGDLAAYPGKAVMLVANPDSPDPGNQPPDDDEPSCVIVIDPSSNTFIFQKTAGANALQYSGGEWSGGRMFAIPFGYFSTQPSTPFWNIFALIAEGTVIILAGSAQTQQVTDGSGNTFYEPGLLAPPAQWTDIRKDTGKRIPNMMRVPIFSGGSGGTTKAAFNPDDPATAAALKAEIEALGHSTRLPFAGDLHYLHGDGGTLRHEIVGSAAGSSQWQMRTGSVQAVITLGAEQGKTDAVEIGGTGGRDASLKVTAAADGAAKAAALSIARHGSGQMYTVHGLTLAPGAPMTFSIARDGGSVTVQNGGAAATCSLTVTPDTGGAQAHHGIALEAARTMVLSPLATSGVAGLRVQVFDHPGGVLLGEVNLA
jgi:hypothetical protein